MKRLTTLTSNVTGPCFSKDGNLVACTSSGYIIEFADKNNYDDTKILYEIDGVPNCISFDENSNDAVICDMSCGNLCISTQEQDENEVKNDNEIDIPIIKKPSILCNEYEGELFKVKIYILHKSNNFYILFFFIL